MKSEPFAAQICDSKLCHGASSLGGFADINVAHIRELPGLHVEVAIRQTRGLLHLGERNRLAGNEGCQDTEATGGANHLVEFELHGVIYFVLRSICPEQTPVKPAFIGLGLNYFVL